MMQRVRANRTTISRLVLVGCLVALAVWVALGNLGSSSPKGGGTPQDVAGVPQSGQTQGLLPQAEPTQAPDIQITPTEPEPTPIPTPEPLEPATLVTSTLSTLAPGLNPNLSTQSEAPAGEPIFSITWAPTGDKLVYVTNTGKLYWSNLDGTGATLLYNYGEPFYNTLDQQPKGNTLLVPGYAIHFTPGQPPTMQEAPDTWGVRQIRWWSADRASGVTGGIHFGGCVGCERLVTFDAEGHRLSSRGIAFMWSGAVQPGGVWLAYATGQESTGTPFIGSYPETVYLVNLNTGQRLQITEPGMGREVFSWSPDGNWFHIAANVSNSLQGVLVSANGVEQIVITPPGGNSGEDAVWRPDSRRLAFSVRIGGLEPGCGTENVPPCETTSYAYVVDVPSRQVTDSEKDPGSSINSPEAMMMHPSWSPDGSTLSFLSFDPDCTWQCSKLSPAFYLLSTK